MHLLDTFLIAKDTIFLHEDNEDTDQTDLSLCWVHTSRVFVGCTRQKGTFSHVVSYILQAIMFIRVEESTHAFYYRNSYL